MIDYQTEANNLNGGFFKPTEGQTTITLLSEMSEKKDREIKNAETGEAEKTIEVVPLEVKVKGERMTWEVPTNTSKSSLYGQLISLGQKWGNLQNQEITLLRQGVGRATRYTILEASSEKEGGKAPASAAKNNKVIG